MEHAPTRHTRSSDGAKAHYFMKVRLPPPLWMRLTHLASWTGRKKPDLLREAVGDLVSSGDAPSKCDPAQKTKMIVFILQTDLWERLTLLAIERDERKNETIAAAVTALLAKYAKLAQSPSCPPGSRIDDDV